MSNDIICLNIGSQNISLGIFRTNRSGHMLMLDYRSTFVSANPQAASSYFDQVKSVLNELFKDLKVTKNTIIYYSLSGQSILTRFIKVTLLDGTSLAEAISFEIQQHIPTSMNEMEWDWDSNEKDASFGEVEVVVNAIKKTTLQSYNSCLEHYQMIAGKINSSAIALYNSYRTNYPDLEETVVLLDIGAKTSNIICIFNNKFFIRNIPFGGNTFTLAIAKELNIDFGEAEQKKCQHGLVIIDDEDKQEASKNPELNQVIQTLINRIPGELSRTTKLFSANYDSPEPTHYLLAGGGSSLRNLKYFLRLKFPNASVDLFNPFKVIAISKKINQEIFTRRIHAFGELVGLASYHSNRVNSFDINLISDSKRELLETKRKLPFVWIGVALVILGQIIALFNFNNHVNESARLLTKKQTEKTALENYNTPIQKITTQLKNIDKKVAPYIELSENRGRLPATIDDIKKSLANHGLWLYELQFLAGYDPSKYNPEKGADSLNIPNLNLTSSKDTYFVPSTKKNAPINALYVKGVWVSAKRVNSIRTWIQFLAKNSFCFSDKPCPFSKQKTSNKKLENNQIIISLPLNKTTGYVGSKFILLLPLKDPFTLHDY